MASPRRGLERERWGQPHHGEEQPQEAEDLLSLLRTDRVVVKTTADVQGLSADLWAGAEKKPRMRSGLQAWLCGPQRAVQPWEVAPCLWSTLPPHISHDHNISTPRSGARGSPKALGPSVPRHCQGPRAPRPGPHLWKASRQHWYTSKLLLLTVVFRRAVQSATARGGT